LFPYTTLFRSIYVLHVKTCYIIIRNTPQLPSPKTPQRTWYFVNAADNPAAAALLSKMGYDEKERVQMKKEFLRMITRMELDPAKERLIYGFFGSKEVYAYFLFLHKCNEGIAEKIGECQVF